MLSYIIAGALLALIYIAIKEKDKIKSVDDIESELNMPIYGVLSAKRHLRIYILNWNRRSHPRRRLYQTTDKKLEPQNPGPEKEPGRGKGYYPYRGPKSPKEP